MAPTAALPPDREPIQTAEAPQLRGFLLHARENSLLSLATGPILLIRSHLGWVLCGAGEFCLAP